jgi:hypothetical protein
MQKKFDTCFTQDEGWFYKLANLNIILEALFGKKGFDWDRPESQKWDRQELHLKNVYFLYSASSNPTNVV